MSIMRPGMPTLRNINALAALLCGVLCIATVTLGKAEELPVANRVVVYKSERRMDLMHGDEVLRSLRISLGLMPTGHKERSGDYRTPEGRYYLTRRNARSDFFLSIQVS